MVKMTAIKFAPGGVPSFNEIFKSGQTAQISTWSNKHGKGTVAKLIFVILEDLNNYFNVARPMNTAQMTDLAIEIGAALWSFRMEEILAFAEAVKKQTYGKIYERLDPSIIWEHFEKYNEARENYFYTEATKDKQYDPRIEDENTARLSSKVTGMAGAISQMRGRIKDLKSKEK